jgi:hypothetical protein
MTSPAPLGIIELGEVCARQRAICLDLFEQVGALVTAQNTTAGADQQNSAAACHRHAWHAELWASRAPTIPPVRFEEGVASHRGVFPRVTDAVGYRTVIDQVRRELSTLTTRFDPLLDPSTARVIALVLADL